MAYDWFRSWHGAPTDLKYILIAQQAGSKPGVVAAVFWALLDYASQNSDRGCIDGFNTETYAAYSGFDEQEIIAIIEVMKQKPTDGKMIEDNRLTAWERRQPKREGSSTERVQRWRKEKREKERQVEASNAVKRDVTQSNASDKESESDKDKDKETDKQASAVRTNGADPAAAVIAFLGEIGVSRSRHPELAGLGYNRSEVEALWQDCMKKPDVSNPQGLLIARMRECERAPVKPDLADYDYLKSKYGGDDTSGAVE